MHLWPSLRLRDSFKNAYLKKLEWNFHWMNVANHQQQQNKKNRCSGEEQNLLEIDGNGSGDSGCGGFVVLCREILMILSCCYCCFCCGACVEDEDSG